MVVRVVVAGGTGVLGRRLVPRLAAQGHQVTATTTSAAKPGLLARLRTRWTRAQQACARRRQFPLVGRATGYSSWVAMMTEGRGFSNTEAQRELGWEPRYPSWRQGFREELA